MTAPLTSTGETATSLRAIPDSPGCGFSGESGMRSVPVSPAITLAILGALLLAALFIATPASAHAADIVNYKKTYTYARMVSDLDKLQKKYPDLLTTEVIGTTPYGRKLYAVKLAGTYSDLSLDATALAQQAPLYPTGTRAVVLINGAHHAREWLSTTLNTYMIEQYCKSYAANGKIDTYQTRLLLAQTDLWFVPMVNPDGVTISQSGVKSFSKKVRKKLKKYNLKSKNYTRWKANAQGIDLNRQYDAGWKQIKAYGAKKPRYANYKGKKPAQAREAKAMIAFTKRINPATEVSYHTAGKVIYWGYQTPAAQKARNKVYAKALSKLTGYKPVSTPKGSGGGYTDWFTNKLKKPGFTLELTTGKKGKSNTGEFVQTWNENKLVPLYLAQQTISALAP